LKESEETDWRYFVLSKAFRSWHFEQIKPRLMIISCEGYSPEKRRERSLYVWRNTSLFVATSKARASDWRIEKKLWNDAEKSVVRFFRQSPSLTLLRAKVILSEERKKVRKWHKL
jgi:hypothetical protein